MNWNLKQDQLCASKALEQDGKYVESEIGSEIIPEGHRIREESDPSLGGTKKGAGDNDDLFKWGIVGPLLAGHQGH